jgi:hypothetical protein
MRSQVQVLAGPPLIVAGQSAAGSGPGALAVGLGRAGAARPIPPAPPVAPSGAAHPAVRLGDDHAPWSRPQPRTAARWRVQPPRAAACSRAHRAATRDGRSARRPGLPGRSAGKRGRHGPHPARRPGSAPTSHRPIRLRQRRPRPGLLDRRSSRRRPGSRRNLHPSCGHGRPATSTWVSQRHRLRWEETDASGRTAADTRRLDTGRVDSRRPSAGLWTTTPGDQTPDGWTARSRTPKRDGWTPHAGHTGDRRRGVAAGSVDHGDDARPLDSGWTLLQADAVRASNNQDRSAARTPRAPTLRMGLATAATVSCRWYAAVQLAPRRTALLGKGWGRE